jgi:hypothetical protein
MPRQSRTKLVPPKLDLGNQTLDTLEEPNAVEQEEKPVLTELDNEIECPICNDIMELNSKFDSLLYYCDCCSLVQKCI